MKNLGQGILCYVIQCAIPVFDGLLEEPYNQQVLDLLFTLAHWHSLAKLRLKTEDTLELLDIATTQLGAQLRDFLFITCANFKTKELEREAAARKRRAAKTKASNTKRTGKNTVPASVPVHGCGPLPPASTHPDPLAGAESQSTSNSQQSRFNSTRASSCSHVTAGPLLSGTTMAANTNVGTYTDPSMFDTTTTTLRAGLGSSSSHPSQGSHKQPSTYQGDTVARREARFNLFTYKHHAFGDYVWTIRRYGTTDSYSTEPVSPSTCLCGTQDPTRSNYHTRASSNIAPLSPAISVPAVKSLSNRWHKLNGAKSVFGVSDSSTNKQGKT
jgi:hypothetical protein